MEKCLLGVSNAATLDCEVFQERGEFRKSAGDAWNKSTIRVQEVDRRACFLGDLFKRWVVGEEIDLRVNFGFTVKRSFDEARKVIEVNYQNLPTIECVPRQEGEEQCPTDAMPRRLIAQLMNKGRRFTTTR